MIPVKVSKERFGSDYALRIEARNQAYQRMYYDIYRSKMRYDAELFSDELGLSPEDIEQINKHYSREEKSELPVKFVTINLPADTDLENAKSLLQRCLKKCYVGDWHYAFELGKDGKHPHYHVYFTSTRSWLAKSRIISEWSRIFGITKNFINVQATSKAQIPNLENYINKEKIYIEHKNHAKGKVLQKGVSSSTSLSSSKKNSKN